MEILDGFIHIFKFSLLQISWFLSGLEKCLVPPYAKQSLSTSPFGTNQTPAPSEDLMDGTMADIAKWPSPTESESVYLPPSKEALEYFSQQVKAGRQGVGSDLSRVNDLYRQVFSTAESFRRLRCDFLPLADRYFSVFMEHFLRCSLENSKLEFKKYS